MRLGKVKVSEEFHKFYSNRWDVTRAQPVVGFTRVISRTAPELCS